MDTEIRQECRRLARKECADYQDGYCASADRPCDAAPKSGGICHRFRAWVLPQLPELEHKVSRFFKPKPEEERNWHYCADCSRPFVPEKKRQVFCPECRKRRRREQTRKAVQHLRQKKRADM